MSTTPAAVPHLAENAEERGQGICRTCLLPIWNEGGTILRRHRPEGWSDRIERGGDSLVCFKAREYRHVPLTGREAAIYDHAYRRGAEEKLPKGCICGHDLTRHHRGCSDCGCLHFTNLQH